MTGTDEEIKTMEKMLDAMTHERDNRKFKKGEKQRLENDMQALTRKIINTLKYQAEQRKKQRPTMLELAVEVEKVCLNVNTSEKLLLASMMREE